MNQTTLEASMHLIIDSQALRRLMIKWIIDRHHSFNEIKAETFRNIIAVIDKAAVSKFPLFANTLHAEIFRHFKEAKAIIAELISNARPGIHLSFDLSTLLITKPSSR